MIIAHRGASARAPENTLAAFRQAIEDGADGIEFDVQASKDGAPVVFHDLTLRRMNGDKRRVSSLTAAELQDIDIGSWFNRTHPRKALGEFVGETIPTLAQTFDLLRGSEGRVYVELKGAKKEMPPLVEAVARAVRRTDLLPRIVLKSFDLAAVAEMRRIFPELTAAALFAPKLSSIFRKQTDLIEQARTCGAGEISLHYSLATRKTMERAAAENMPVTIWTIDRPAWVRRAAEIGIHAIITNNPARLIAERNK